MNVLTSLRGLIKSSLMDAKRSEMNIMLSLKYQPSGKVKSQSYLEESSLSPQLVKS